METTTKKFQIERTKSRLPARWEWGGGASNTGEASIIAGADGKPKRAVYVKRAGHLSNGKHALIILEVGDIIVESHHHRQDFWTRIYRVQSFENDYATCELVNVFSKGQWDAPLPAYLQPAVTAAMQKATCYHCRSPHFVAN